MNKEREYYIGEIAKLLGISQRTIRYYEELGFINPGRSNGRFRIYAESDYNRLRTILHLKELGMSLEEIGALLHLRKEGSVHDVSPKLREALLEKREEFESKLKKYREGIKELESLLSIIENCKRCTKKADEEVCHKCIDERSKKLPPLVKEII